MYNTLVGKAGGSTGTQRGYITSKYVMPSYVTNGHRFIRAEYCAKDGDSGAAVFNTNTAYGIHPGGAQIAGSCPNSDEYGVFGNIVYATDALGVSLLASP